MEKDSIRPLALRPREAARVLGICQRTLWALTAPRGPIPCVKHGHGARGGLVLYRIADLDEWLRRSACRPANGGPDDAAA
jgi:hypothetical protein